MARILVADDDPDQLRAFLELLESDGHRVALACSRLQVLRQAEWAELIIMDLRMPDAVTGLGLIREIRHSGHGGPVIVVSGWPDELYGQPEERMVSRVMVKPVPIPELFEAIRELTA